MKRCLLFLLLIGLVPVYVRAISPYPCRGLCIRAPHPQAIDDFIDFIGNDLRQAEVNLIVLMIDYNYNHRAIDLVPKDVVICDWHYERPDPTAAFFAAKRFRVLSCPWRKADVAIDQVNLMHSFIEGSTRAMKPRYLGMMQTVWSPAAAFIDHYRGAGEPDDRTAANAECFHKLSRVWNK